MLMISQHIYTLNFKKCVSLCLIFISLSLSLSGHATLYSLPKNPNDTVIGQTFLVQSQSGDTLRKMAKRYGMGVRELQIANPHYQIDDPISAHKTILIPAMYILPAGPHEGIVVNLDEFRLYYYLPNHKQVLIVPVGIGKDGWNTPVFTGKIIKKKKNPEWNVPKSVYDYNIKKGIVLPKVMPPGPNNPLGQYAMFTSQPGYLIHGTNRPYGVGDRVSSGCLRRRADDIAELFTHTGVGTTIRVIMQPYKIGQLDNTIYLEAHKPLHGYDEVYQTSLTPLVSMVLLNDDENYQVDWAHIQLIANQSNGIAQPIAELKHA